MLLRPRPHSASARHHARQFLIINKCSLIRRGLISNVNQQACSRCHVHTHTDSLEAVGTSKPANRHYILRIYEPSVGTETTATAARRRTVSFGVKEEAETGCEVNTALPASGVPKKTVSSAKPARLNININMLVRALALAGSIKFRQFLPNKHKI